MGIRTRRERLQTCVARTFPRMALQSEVMRGTPPGMLASLLGKTGIRVIEALLGVNRQLGTTTVIITHNASIQEVADRVLFFADGRISRIQNNQFRKEAAQLTW